MPIKPTVPRELRLMPFRGTDAVRRSLLTPAQLRSRAWHRMLPDIYIHAQITPDYRKWCYAAHLVAGPTGALSGLSALFMWGIDLLPRGEESDVEITVPRTVRLAPRPRIRVIRSDLPHDDVATSHVRLTTPVRTAFDLGRRHPTADATVAIDAMLGKRLLTVSEFGDFVAGRTRYPGGAALPLILDRIEPLTESPMETRLRLVLIDGGLPRPVAQFRAYDGAQFLGRLDLAYPELKIGIEYDGDHHREREQFRDDTRRRNAFHAAGWTILHFTASDVLRNPSRIVAQVGALLAR